MRYSLSFFAFLLAGTVQAQNIDPQLLPPGRRWNVGLKGGTGLEFTPAGATTVPPANLSYFTGGITGGYLLARTLLLLTLQADVLITNRSARPWQSPGTHNGSLFVPIYLRTGQPKERLHLLLGAGPMLWLSGGERPANFTGRYATHPAELTGVMGIETRILPLSQHLETTVSLTYRRSFTRSLTTYAIETGGADRNDYYSWVGATVNVYLHQPQRPH